MGFLNKLVTCVAIGIGLTPYYLYSSSNTIGYKNVKERPAIVRNINPESLEEKVIYEKPTIENPYKDQTIIVPKKEDPPVKLTEKNYQIIEDKDFILFRGLGYIGSLPIKAFFMDLDVNNYVKPDTKASIERLLEADNKVDGLTVRLNHTNPIHDSWRLFTDKDLRERNNFFARLFLGLPSTFFGEFFAKFARCDYYNPYTKVAALYSNVEGIAKHEIGHHRDFMRFDKDWVYSLSRLLPPVTLYQEWQASSYSKWTLEEKSRTDFGRFLIPAYATYTVAAMFAALKLYLWWNRRRN